MINPTQPYTLHRPFSGDPPSVELERARNLRERLKRLVRYSDPRRPTQRVADAPWDAWGQIETPHRDANASERFDDWGTALACLQGDEAKRIAQDVIAEWKQYRLWLIGHMEAKMIEQMVGTTDGWVERIAAKTGR